MHSHYYPCIVILGIYADEGLGFCTCSTVNQHGWTRIRGRSWNWIGQNWGGQNCWYRNWEGTCIWDHWRAITTSPTTTNPSKQLFTGLFFPFSITLFLVIGLSPLTYFSIVFGSLVLVIPCQHQI